ncbi:putative ribonuclease H-like domain-containing protein [Tanacetum coccineum]
MSILSLRVGIKRLLDDLGFTAAKVRVTAAKQNSVLFIIENGNITPKTIVVEGVEKVIPPTTAEEKAQGDAKSLMQAVEKRFGGNAATKKTQRNLLKQQYENFTASSLEVLDQTFDRLQKLISQLEIHGKSISQEDVNQKFLRSLSPEWNTHTIVLRNKPDIDTLNLDDLYKNLKIYEPEVKGTSSSSTNTQNIAFVFSNSTSSTNRAVNTGHGATTTSTQASVVNSTTITNLSDAVICAFFASQPNSLQFNNEDLQKIHPDDLEETDLRWQMAMLTMRARRFLKKTGRKFSVNGNETIGFDNDQAEEGPTNFALMAYISTSSNSKVSADSNCSSSCLENVKNLKEQNKQLLKDLRTSKLNVIAYKTGLESVEARLLVYKKNESVYKEDIKVLKRYIHLSEVGITELRRKLELAQKQKDEIQLIVENFENSSKNLSKLINCQIVDKYKTEFMNEPIVNEPTVKKPAIETSEAKASADKPKVVRKNNGALIIKKWVSVSEDEAKSKPKIVKKTGKPSFAKTKFIKSKEQGNPQQDLEDQGVIDCGCSRHLTGNMSYFTDFEEINRGYVSFRGNPKGGKIIGKEKPALGFMKPFECPVTILNTIDHLGKFDGKADEGFFVGYSINGKAFRVFNSRTRIVEENLHVQFSENTPNIAGSVPNWLFDIDALIKLMNYKPVVIGNQSSGNAGIKACDYAGKARMETVPGKDYILLPLWTADPPFTQSSKSSPDDGFKHSGDDEKKVTEEPGKEGGDPRKDSEGIDQEKADNVNNTNTVNAASTNEVNVVNAKTSIELPIDPNMPELEDINYSYDDEDVGAEADMNNLDTFMPASPIPTTRVHKDHLVEQIIGDLNSTPQTRRMINNLKEHVIKSLDFGGSTKLKRAIGTKWVFWNKKDERGIVIQNKARLVTQGYTQEEGIDYDEVFTPVARIEAIRLFLAYASFKDFMVYQMDLKSAFLYGKIKKEVYVYQKPGFEDPDFPNRVYKVEKAHYGLHQALRAWYETLSTYLLDNRLQRGKINKTLFIRRDKEFEKMMHKKFQMSSIGELTFFLGLQVKQKVDGSFISQDKYVTEILKKFGFTDVKTASTPMETQKALLKDEDGKEVDVHLYRSMIGSLMYLTSSKPDIMFVVCAYARYQVNPKVSHLYAVKRIFRYLKGHKLGLYYPKDSPFDLVAYTDSDYAGASLDRKSTTGGCQFLGCKLISWQCKKQTVVANSTIEAEYVAASSCCGQVLWIQNQLLDYGNHYKEPTELEIQEMVNILVSGEAYDKVFNHLDMLHAPLEGKVLILTTAKSLLLLLV